MKSSLLFTIILVAVSYAHAKMPVKPAADQQVLLKSTDAKLAANKKLVYDFTRIVLRGRRLDQAHDFLRKDYIQHNPNVETGLKGFLAFFSKLPGGQRPIPETVPNLVSIQAEGDIVTMSFVDERKDPGKEGSTYTTTWFDMFRVQDGKIAEHWDCDVRTAK